MTDSKPPTPLTDVPQPSEGVVPVRSIPPTAIEPPTATAERAAPIARPSVRTIFDDHFEFVWRALRRLGVPEADLDDGVQEVFMVVHRKLPEFEARSRITTWLYGIAFRIASERHRRSNAHERVELDETAEPTQDPDPEQRYAGREARDRLDEVLAQLDLDKRAVFVLYELDELPVERIAEMLEIPVGTVYSRLRAARQEFERALQRSRRRWSLAERGRR